MHEMQGDSVGAIDPEELENEHQTPMVRRPSPFTPRSHRRLLRKNLRVFGSGTGDWEERREAGRMAVDARELRGLCGGVQGEEEEELLMEADEEDEAVMEPEVRRAAVGVWKRLSATEGVRRVAALADTHPLPGDGAGVDYPTVPRPGAGRHAADHPRA